MDSGFCVLKGFIGVYQIVVYDSVVVTKRRYCPSGMYGYKMNARFLKEMGENDCHSGNWNVIEFDVFVVKDSN